MKKYAAIIEMKKGVKITHTNFSPDEWMTMENGQLVLEDGVRCKPSEFWNYRTDKSWTDDYSVYDEN